MSNVVKKENFKVSLTEKVIDFKKKNQEFDLGFIELGTFLKLTKTGKLQSTENDKIVFNEINAVIVGGRSQFVLWGKEGTPQEDQLLFSTETEEEAVNALEELAAKDEMFSELYSRNDISARYIITLVGEDGNIYAINLSKSSKFEFGSYSKLIYSKHEAGVSEVITKISAQEKTSGKNSWIAAKFDFVEKLGDE